MHLAVAPGLSVALHDLGGSRVQGAGAPEDCRPPLLLAHATGFHGMVWRPLAAALADRWHAHAIDFRGHGDSPLPPGLDITWEGFADDVLAAVDALGGGPLAAIGHSKGGAALLTADIRRPGTFSALYLYEPIVLPPASEGPAISNENPLAAGAARRRADFPSRAAAIENYASKSPFSRLRADALEAYVEHGFADTDDGITLKCRPEVEAATYRAGSALRTWERLGEISCPVTIAAGGDGGPPAINAPLLAARIPGARLAVHDELGHLGPLEDPDRVAAEARAFFLET
jgi:pimeloyl-ACP methyl ester carboxylesterase